jgi:hypothetical protein
MHLVAGGDESSTRVVTRPSSGSVHPEIVSERMRSTGEAEAESMVTRICDWILSRLNGNEAPDDETKTEPETTDLLTSYPPS